MTYDPNDQNDPRNWPGGGAHCAQCGAPLVPENMVGAVERKETAALPGEVEGEPGIISVMCRTCFGLPDGL